MLRAVLRGVLTGALRAPDVAPPVVAFSPRQLFANGEQGGWWDPSDLSTMFQDSAGTTPVTAVGQPVGLIRDKSGKGNHLLQATAASRPVLAQDAGGFLHLSFDGVDDGFAIAGTVDFSATNKLSAWVGATKLSDTAFGLICELTAVADSTDGGFNVGHGATPGDAGRRTWTAAIRGTIAANVADAFVFASPDTRVISAMMDTSAGSAAAQVIMRLNGVAQTLANSGVTSAGNLATATMFIGRRGGLSSPFKGRIYNLIVRGTASSAAQIAQTERFVGSKMGIAL